MSKIIRDHFASLPLLITNIYFAQAAKSHAAAGRIWVTDNDAETLSSQFLGLLKICTTSQMSNKFFFTVLYKNTRDFFPPAISLLFQLTHR
jgi:hypothetical protein